jgi:catechol 2,3-dioxygenase-like lactoylglutathione lyase family enzyme
MPLDSIVGLDHVVVVVRDLAKAADAWRGLGFTVSDRGTHSAHMGTGNHTLMLGEDYLELLGVLTPTERNAPTRALLEQREGIERLAFTTSDAGRGVAALQARDIASEGPIAFSRPVELPDGSMSEARFETFLWPRDERPGGVRLFACQHFTRETVWLPHLEMLSADPKAAAEHMCRLTGETPERIADGWRVQSGGARGVFEFVDRTALFARHYGVTFGKLPQEGAMTLVLQVADLAAAKATTSRAGAVWHGNRVTVPPANANGVILVFQT